MTVGISLIATCPVPCRTLKAGHQGEGFWLSISLVSLSSVIKVHSVCSNRVFSSSSGRQPNTIGTSCIILGVGSLGPSLNILKGAILDLELIFLFLFVVVFLKLFSFPYDFSNILVYIYPSLSPMLLLSCTPFYLDLSLHSVILFSSPLIPLVLYPAHLYILLSIFLLSPQCFLSTFLASTSCMPKSQDL